MADARGASARPGSSCSPGCFAIFASVDPLIPILLIVGSGLAVFVVIALVSRKPLTALGAEVRDHLKGLKEFIEWAEADRIRMLQSPTGAERVRDRPERSRRRC